MVRVATHLVSESRVQECLDSARFWTDEIGPYANRMRERADRYAIISSVLSALTGLGVWSTLAASTRLPAVIAVSFVGVIAAVVGIIPKIKGYGDCAEKAALLGPRYGHVLGELIDALEMLRQGDRTGPSRADEAVKEFEAVKTAKDALRPFPGDLEKKRRKDSRRHKKN